MRRRDVDARGCETDRQGIIMGRKGIQIMYSVGECFYWAEGSGTGCVVHGSATLVVLLVVKVKSNRIRRSQFVKWRIMRQDVALFESGGTGRCRFGYGRSALYIRLGARGRKRQW